MDWTLTRLSNYLGTCRVLCTYACSKKLSSFPRLACAISRHPVNGTTVPYLHTRIASKPAAARCRGKRSPGSTYDFCILHNSTLCEISLSPEHPTARALPLFLQPPSYPCPKQDHDAAWTPSTPKRDTQPIRTRRSGPLRTILSGTLCKSLSKGARI